ncbi:hypothetical protein [Jannaschia aquimarina]|uniref:Uncharacterized protein n=1 Tax=Jannaschia aquimarina TaxID=935700 RepID=A0A0D1D4B0_9RHOB|nr:hypothetical protein [Jannaschia aquimarina]KIT14898.1 hypothetical protein jaqu_32230 [Jannaschia aquimarina]SNS58765.1 hypothetical protein SAMN05421775_101548 [Jannaschia aquimarina]
MKTLVQIRTLVLVFGLAALLFSVGSLVFGWHLDVQALVRFRPGQPAMVPSTALCIALLAAAVVIGPGFGQARMAKRLAVVAVVVALGNLLIRTLVDDRGFESLLPYSLDTFDKMSNITITGAVLAGISVIQCARDAERDRAPDLAYYPSIAGLSLFGGLLLGHSFDPTSIRHLPQASGLSFYTALMFAAIFLCLILAPQAGHWQDASDAEPE